ncbi:hypothetical protein [Orrella sp. 11846]|uniref:hypothetical protein n=1 Tax=Orrella sp. 11846 TaxID=3409913 RepID=UPI003B5901CF
MKLRHSEPYTRLRQQAYPKIGDQLDAIFKLAKHMKDSGEELPTEVTEWLDRCQAVKDKFPKR